MFYPKLTRRDSSDYFNSRQKFYADYKKNLSKVSEDCQHRCVYCDTLTAEIGGEGMHLDHFRPQRHFPKLSTHPYNLYLSCPKCNLLKSCDWPAGKFLCAQSYSGGVGYFDPFITEPESYFAVKESGEVEPLQSPASYMINRLQLNRLSRVQVRRKRILFARQKELSTLVTKRLKLLRTKMEDESYTKSVVSKELSRIIDIKERLDKMF